MPLLINFSKKYGILAYTCFHNVMPIANAVWLSVVITLKFLTLIQISQKNNLPFSMPQGEILGILSNVKF